jgi:DNA-directed RNA polymerase specialized sigma subunit
MEDELDDTPTDQQLADRVGISAKRVGHLRSAVRAPVYESRIQGSDDGESGGDPAIETGETDPTMNAAVNMVYESLNERDKVIFDLKTGAHGKQMVDNQTIAKRLGVTPALISQRSAQISQMIKETQERV